MMFESIFSIYWKKLFFERCLKHNSFTNFKSYLDIDYMLAIALPPTLFPGRISKQFPIGVQNFFKKN